MSKGMMLIEAFRAERLKQRQALRQRTCDHAASRLDAAAAIDPLPTAGIDGARSPDTSRPAGRSVTGAPETSLAPAGGRQAAACACGERLAAHPHVQAWRDLPLTGIGIGSAMTLRLGQLGIHTTRDLANADAVALRLLLGDVSRLLDVDAWIDAARRDADPHGPVLNSLE